MTRETEQDLIRRALEGDRSASEAFIRHHQPSLYAYMLRLSGRPDVAEDIVQEAFVRVLTNLDRFDFRYRFSTWLFTIAKRLYVNACQKHRPAYDSDLVGSWEGSVDTPEYPIVRNEILDNARIALQRALAELPVDQREILILFHQQSWPIVTIAEHMDMPQGTVKSHLHRGRRKMRDLLEHHEDSARHIQEVWM